MIINLNGTMPAVYDVNRVKVFLTPPIDIQPKPDMATNDKAIQVASLLARGFSLDEIKTATGMSVKDINHIADMARQHSTPGMVKMSHEDRQKRTKTIAQYLHDQTKAGVKADKLIKTASDKWGVSVSLIRNIVQQHGIQLIGGAKPKQISAGQVMTCLANIILGDSMAGAGEKAGITRQRAEQLRDEAATVGLLAAVLAADADKIRLHIRTARKSVATAAAK